jgi:mediator of RNA polymerase II transcription subunit 22
MQSRNLQSKEALLKSYNSRLKEDVKSIQENFEGKARNLLILQILSNLVFLTEIIKLAKGETDNQTQLGKMTLCELDAYEMQVRSANIGNYGTL